MWLIFSIVICFLVIIVYLNKPALFNLNSPIQIQGVRIRASLDEIYNKILPTQKIDIVAILNTQLRTIWSDDIQLHLSSTYYDINEYILILRKPIEVDINSLSIYAKEVNERFQFILQRSNIVISLTNSNGINLNTNGTYIMKTIYTAVLGCIIIGIGLFITLKISKFFFRVKGRV
jgi:hypothetical protein